MGNCMEIPGALWRNMIFRYSSLPSNAKLIGAYLSTWMDDHGNNCYPSVKRISHETGLSNPTTCKYIGILRDEGWLACKKHGYDAQNWARNHYYPVIPQSHREELSRQLNSFNTFIESKEGSKAERVRQLNSEGKAVKELSTSTSVTSSVRKKDSRSAPDFPDCPF